ncbi:rhamnogalacturonan acetylesterase [Novosphingobium profundi]|uniref:rhamnogalacturonan acetylesterase n=1 Tax=Novosphingobium profundi TaxID=1774954 RepID=UPI001BDAD7FE|nr:rhamnogalacturonan acetylesterase [Novosphingobium profundi]MBT0669226.1 rhamnogalacturonan acetylesterase [Novosphingobium profundi]
MIRPSLSRLAPSLLAIAATLLLAAAPPANDIPPDTASTAPTRPAARVFIASDSTAAHYGAAQFPQMGWGMFLGCALPGDVQVVNMAHGGRSTGTYVSDGFWAQLTGALEPGDTVLIQFGHNDEDTTKMFRHVDPPQYAQNLARFVAEVRARKAVPVLLTPIARDEFDAGGHIRETHGAWADAVRRVAAETQTPLIDLDALAREWLGAAGPGKTGADRYFLIYDAADKVARFPEGHRDTTHLNELGARSAAALVAGALAKLDVPLAKRVHAPDPALQRALGAPTCW